MSYRGNRVDNGRECNLRLDERPASFDGQMQSVSIATFALVAIAVAARPSIRPIGRVMM
jgi:hypothetical protein